MRILDRLARLRLFRRIHNLELGGQGKSILAGDPALSFLLPRAVVKTAFNFAGSRLSHAPSRFVAS